VPESIEARGTSAAVIAVGAGLALLAVAGVGLLVLGLRRRPAR
jgi:hypothetical protein